MPSPSAGHALAQADALVLEEVRALAVDDELELLAGNEAADAEVLDRELVFAVGREVVPRASCRRACRAAAPRCAGSATYRPARDRSPRSASSSSRPPCGRRAPPPSCTTRAASARSSANRRCCRSRWPNRPAAAASATSMSRSSRSRIAFAYSVRFSRWRTTAPGLTCAAALPIDFGLEQVAQAFVFGQRRALHVRRRHHAGAQLAHDLFPELRHDRRRRRGRSARARGCAVFSRSLWQVTQVLIEHGAVAGRCCGDIS